MCMRMDMDGGNYASKRKRKRVRRNTNADDSPLLSRSDIAQTKRMHEHKKQENNNIETFKRGCIQIEITTRNNNSRFDKAQKCGLGHRTKPCSDSEASDSEILAISLEGQMLCMQNL